MRSLRLALVGMVILFSLGYSHTSFAQNCLAYGAENNPGCASYFEYRNKVDAEGAAANQAANNAKAQRQRQIRKQEEQDRIAKYKSTPFYGAIVMNKEFRTKFQAGERTEEEAKTKALQGYPAGEAHVIATFSNTCAAVSAPEADVTKVIVATARERQTALNMAWNQCEAKYGKDKCIMHLEVHAVCSGYDYGEYTKFGFWERFFEG